MPKDNKKQVNVRLSPGILEMLNFLTDKYGSQTQAIEVAVALLYTQFVNENAPQEGRKP